MTTFEGILQSAELRAPIFVADFKYGEEAWRYTTGGYVYNDSGLLYSPHPIKIPKIRRSTSETTTSVDLVLPDNDPVVQWFDAFLPTEPVTCRIRQVELNNTDGRSRAILIGDVTNVDDNGDGTAKLTVKPTYEATNRNVPYEMQQATCPLMVYGKRCGVNADLFKTISNGLIAQQGLRMQSAAFIKSDPTWFKAGYVRCLRTREVRFIVDHQAEGVIVINYPFTAATIGDTYEAYAGCMKTGDICLHKFNNKRRFLGLENVPDRNIFKTGLK